MPANAFYRRRSDTVRLTEDDTASWEQSLYEQLMRDLPTPGDAREEPTALFILPAPRAPNVFETPRTATDPPPLWETLPRVRRQRRSKLPLLVLAMALGIAFGLWRDRAARADVVMRAHAIGALLRR